MKKKFKSKGAEMIAKERERQVAKEGWDADHDSEHDIGELAKAAICYVTHAVEQNRIHRTSVPKDWPWDDEWWKPKEPLRDLVRAGALIAAEIDRLLANEKALDRLLADEKAQP